MNTKYLGALVLLLAACSGKEMGDPGAAGDTLSLKRAAAEAAAQQAPIGDDNAPKPAEDACAQHSWYGDGVCDSFCSRHDTDCVPDGEQTVCADFIALTDGTCSRPEADPCRFQDPDCAGQSKPNAGSGSGVVCATISEVSDGLCGRPDSDACRFQDPDCLPLGGGAGGGSNGSGSAGGPGTTDPVGTGPVCPAIAEVANGKCERPASDPCRSIDPDCVVACAEYVEQADGVCRRDPNDPCIFQDPDCKQK